MVITPAGGAGHAFASLGHGGVVRRAIQLLEAFVPVRAGVPVQSSTVVLIQSSAGCADTIVRLSPARGAGGTAALRAPHWPRPSGYPHGRSRSVYNSTTNLCPAAALGGPPVGRDPSGAVKIPEFPF